MVNKTTYSFKQAGFAVSLFCFTLFSSCNNSDKVIAQVDDSVLLESEALILMEHLGYDRKDEKDFKLFLEMWCEQESFRLEIVETDPQTAKLIELRAKSYAGDLSKFYLEELSVMNKMDTSISEAEMKNYYNRHKEEFALQDYLVKALYMKVEKGAKIEESLQTHFLLKNDKDLSKVNSYAKLYAENFYFDDEQWIYFNDLTKDIPLKGYNKDNIVLNRTKTYFSDEEFTYFINIIDFKLKDAIPPYEFLEPQIREIILSKRSNNLKEINALKLIQTIKNKHEIKINL